MATTAANQLTLEITVWPKHNTAKEESDTQLATARFAGISNYGEVARALET